MTKSARMSCIVGSALLIASGAGAAEHTLMPSPQTVHIGYFLASLKPVLTIDFITKRFPHLTREEAYMIASVAVDYHVTQVVDGTKGIHGMIPKAIFTAQR